jgi:hypothetical protein
MEVAIVAALIVATAGITQATITARGAGIAARQKAVEHYIALLRKLQEELAAMDQAATAYFTELGPDFFDDGNCRAPATGSRARRRAGQGLRVRTYPSADVRCPRCRA